MMTEVEIREMEERHFGAFNGIIKDLLSTVKEQRELLDELGAWFGQYHKLITSVVEHRVHIPYEAMKTEWDLSALKTYKEIGDNLLRKLEEGK
jgi:hypothetical protein